MPAPNTKRKCRILTLSVLSCVLGFFGGVNGGHYGETLYNGIVLPPPWPPLNFHLPVSVEKGPVISPYLLAPPAVFTGASPLPEAVDSWIAA
jgi:hypothetical protein